MTSADNKTVARWVGWLERLSKEVLQLHHNRQLFTELRDAVLQRAPDAPANWLHHYAHVYAHSQAIAIRRAVRGDRRSISLTRLIGEMKNNAVVLTSERHVALYQTSEGWRDYAEGLFEKEWGDGGGHVSPTKLHRQLSRLMQDLTTALDWADKVAAHIVEEGPEPSMTFAELHAAIDRVGEAFNELSLLLTASTWILQPSIAADWRAPFRQPLFDPRR